MVANDLVITSSYDGNVYAYSPDGTVLWSQYIGLSASQPAYYEDRFYVASYRDRIGYLFSFAEDFVQPDLMIPEDGIRIENDYLLLGEESEVRAEARGSYLAQPIHLAVDDERIGGVGKFVWHGGLSTVVAF